MIINARSSNFMFVFPKGFWSEKISQKWMPYIKRNPILPYDSLDTFMSSTIQSVTFPTINIEQVQQIRTLGKQQEYTSAKPVKDLITREMSVTFRLIDGNVNYLIFVDNLYEYLDFKSEMLYQEDLMLRFLDQEGHIVSTSKYKGVYPKSVSEVSLSYSSNDPTFQTFSASFGFFEQQFLIEND